MINTQNKQIQNSARGIADKKFVPPLALHSFI